MRAGKFPRHCRMFMAHLHRWALAFLGVWAAVISDESAAYDAAVGTLSHGFEPHQGRFAADNRVAAARQPPIWRSFGRQCEEPVLRLLPPAA